MKKIAKACNVAFSMYSKIPMPRFEWASEDMRYHLFFFPRIAGMGLVLYEGGIFHWIGFVSYHGNCTANSCDRWLPFGWLYGYERCAKQLPGTG